MISLEVATSLPTCKDLSFTLLTTLLPPSLPMCTSIASAAGLQTDFRPQGEYDPQTSSPALSASYLPAPLQVIATSPPGLDNNM